MLSKSQSDGINMNQVKLKGRLGSTPEFAHSNHSTEIWNATLDVQRLSGVVDHIPISFPCKEEDMAWVEGDFVELTGQFRSCNIKVGDQRRLLLYVFTRDIESQPGGSEEYLNEITIGGHICKKPLLRRTTTDVPVCDIMLAVQRRPRLSDYIPVIAWGKLGIEASEMSVSDVLGIDGRIQSRVYKKKLPGGSTEERTAYEVSVMRFHESEEADE